jgi:prepilin-type processing-associated H-X9-DG protein
MMLSCIVEGGGKQTPFTQDAEFTRLTERDVAELKIMGQRIHEMEILATALKAFHTAYPSTFPEELSGLSDGFLDSPQLVVSSGSRILEYSPNAPWNQGYSERPEEMTSQDYLLQREKDALAGWLDFPNAPPLLRIRYSTPPMILEIREANPSSVERVDPGNRLRCSSSPPTPSTPEIQARFIESCQNNMGQLGVVLKMFANEAEEKRLPAGWATTVPDFLTDTNVLTCPSVTGEVGSTRSVSYELLFPTINEEELVILAEEMGLDTGDMKALKHKVPVIIENHPCADGKSRNVVFWDGHPERIEDARWAELIAPFVRAGDKYIGDL